MRSTEKKNYNEKKLYGISLVWNFFFKLKDSFDSIFKPQDSFDFNKGPSKGFRISLDLNSDVKRGLKADKIVEC